MRTRLPLLLPLLIAGVTLAAFWPSLWNGYVNWDDHEYVLQNPWIRAPSLANLRAIWTESRGANYHPLVFMTHLAEYRLWGLHPAGYHAVNLALHLLTALLVWRYALQLGLGPWSATLAALWFAVHPMRVESVAWIAERKDVLCGLFYMLALTLYARRPWLATGVFALALLSKPMAVTWPLVTVLDDLHRRRPRDRRWWIEKGVMLLPAVAIMAATWIVQREKAGIQPDLLGQVGANLLLACRAYVFYLGKTLAPWDVCAFYPRTEWDHAIPLAVLIVWAGAALSALAVMAHRRGWHLLNFGLAWYALVLFPVCGVVPVGYCLAADRYSYLPLIGLLIAAAWALGALARARPRGRPAIVALCALSIALSAWRTADYCRVWRDGESLWEHIVRHWPSHYSLRFLAMAQLDKGELAEAERNIRWSLRYSETQYGRFYLAEILRHAGKTDEARRWYETFLSQQDYVPALAGYGLLLMDTGEPARAEQAFRRCTGYEPDVSVHHARLGWALMDQSRAGEAETEFATALRLDPNDGMALYNYGVMLLGQQRLAEAETAFRATLRGDPDDVRAMTNLGVVLREQGRIPEALQLLRRALALAPDETVIRAALNATEARAASP